MRIEVIYDTICPWCFVGKRRLERALSRRPDITPRLRWRPFLLNPDMPPEGMNRRDYLERKFGGTARAERMLASLRDVGRSEGIAFDFDAISITPNSVDSHRLVKWGEAQGVGSAVVQAIFKAYFMDGRNIGIRQTLSDIAASVGLDRAKALAFLDSGEMRAEIFMENAQTHRLSINGVPSFVFEDSYGIAGAQDPDILVRLIDMTAEVRVTEPLSQSHSLPRT